jgi:hypothetical protein
MHQKSRAIFPAFYIPTYTVVLDFILSVPEASAVGGNLQYTVAHVYPDPGSSQPPQRRDEPWPHPQ